ncbi:MAG TPA: hypothetical protein VMR25_02025 [Planctomycetaceae bacterium]|jgi:hypothetical protein|nr:hypothetical protein [Planctomycetaceae bacterium]
MRNQRKPAVCRTAARLARRTLALGLSVPMLLFSAEAPAADHLAEQSAKPVFRSSDRRPRHDDVRLKQLGITSFESKRLKLYTDVAAEKVQSLLPAVDAAYDALVDYFGPLPPNPERTDFQVTGYLMADKPLFQRAGLLPEDLPPFLNGRHQEQEFWVNEQETDYYRRHLVIHEVTHCFMFAIPGVDIPGWYMEGMAELFGTHGIDAQGRYKFRVMPDRPERFDGLGRIPLVRIEIAKGQWKSLEDLERLTPAEFLNNTAYAWSWAACALLDGHPRYSQRFRELGKHTFGREFASNRRRLFSADLPRLRTDWALFTHQLQFGYDLTRAAIDFEAGKPLGPGETRPALGVAANRGWQPSGIALQQGHRYEIAASGEITLAKLPKPWISQPQGISIVYAEGHPIGMLLAAVRREPPVDGVEETMLKEIVVGRNATFVAATTGTLYLRINDRWGSLADNEGGYRVVVRELADTNP